MATSAHRDPSHLDVLAVPAWAAELPWLVHGFSTRPGGASTVYRPDHPGELNLGFTAHDSRAEVLKNRELLVSYLLGEPVSDVSDRLVMVKQVHSSITHRVDALPAGEPEQPREGDGLITDTPGVLLGILTADCVPVLVVDRARRAVGAFHAGWRGTVGRIVELGIQKMRDEFGSEPGDLLAAIGPAIGACCYNVGEEVKQQFSAQFSYAGELLSHVSPGVHGEVARLQLDLAEANRRQLLAAGVRGEAITMTGACTSCHVGRFFSYRAEHGVTGRMMAVIGIRTRTG